MLLRDKWNSLLATGVKVHGIFIGAIGRSSTVCSYSEKRGVNKEISSIDLWFLY